MVILETVVSVRFQKCSVYLQMEQSENKTATQSSQLPGILGGSQQCQQSRQTTLQSFFSQPYQATSAKAQAINRALAEFVVMDQRPVNIIEGQGFQNLMKVLDPRYKVISRNN